MSCEEFDEIDELRRFCLEIEDPEPQTYTTTGLYDVRYETMYTIPEERRQKPCRYRNLNGLERSVLTNGCGPKGGWFNPPDYMFSASCRHHDANYWLGGHKHDRKKADDQFLDAMLHDAEFKHYSTSCGGLTSKEKRSWLMRTWLKGAAWRYYWAVRAFGGDKGFFNYHRGMSNDQQWGRVEKVMSARGYEEEANWEE